MARWPPTARRCPSSRSARSPGRPRSSSIAAGRQSRSRTSPIAGPSARLSSSWSMIAAVGAVLLARLGPSAGGAAASAEPGSERLVRGRGQPDADPGAEPDRRPRPSAPRRSRRAQPRNRHPGRPPTPTRPAGTTYTVKAGDTLSAIAARFGTTVKAIQDAQRHQGPVTDQAGPGPQAPVIPAQRWQPRQYEVTNPPGLTSVIRVPQRGQGWPPLSWTARKSRTCVSKVGGTRSRRTSIAFARVVPRRAIQLVDLLRAQATSAFGTAAAGRRGGSRRCRRCRSRRRTPGS